MARQASHMGRSGIVVEGVDAVVKEFTFHAETVKPAAAALVLYHAEQTAETARQLVPVGQGKTRDSITADRHIESHSYGNEVAAEVGPTWFVGRLLEYGTVHMSPRPFLGPATDTQIPEFERDMDKLARW